MPLLCYLVPVAGLEPARCRQRWILSPLRLPFHHTGRCACAAFISNADRCRPSFYCGRLKAAGCRHRLRYPANVLGAARRRPSPTAALAAPSLYLPLAALGLATVGFASTTSTFSSHRHRCFNSIIHPVKNSKQNFRWPISLQKLLVFPVFRGMIWFSAKI